MSTDDDASRSFTDFLAFNLFFCFCFFFFFLKMYIQGDRNGTGINVHGKIASEVYFNL